MSRQKYKHDFMCEVNKDNVDNANYFSVFCRAFSR